MRKLVILGLLVLMLVGLTVPAFAIGSSGTSEIVYYPVIDFEVINWDEGNMSYSVPYPFSSGMLSGSAVGGFYDNFYEYTQTTTLEGDNVFPTIRGTLTFPGVSNFHLVGGPQFIELSKLKNGAFSVSAGSNGVELISASVSLQYYNIDISDSGTSYIASSGYYSKTISAIYGAVLDIGSLFADLDSVAVDGNLLFCNYIDLSISCRQSGVETIKINFASETTYRLGPGGSNNFATWFYLNNVRYTAPTDPDSLTTWLTDSISSFLDFELFPGFSINKIFLLVLTVGIMLWFITLLI